MASSGIKRLFISYSREDITFAKALRSHLKPLVHNGRLEVFFDTDSIEKGEDWEAKILRQLQQADAFILLISRQYFDSEYVLKMEIPNMILRYQNEQVKLWPFYVSHYAWEDFELEDFKLSSIQAIGPFDANERLIPLTGLSNSEQELQYNRIYVEIKDWVDQAIAIEVAEEKMRHQAKEEERIEREKLAEANRKTKQDAQRKAEAKREAEEDKKKSAIEPEQTTDDGVPFWFMVFTGCLLGSVIGGILGTIFNDWEVVKSIFLFGVGGMGVGVVGWAVERAEKKS